MANFPQELHSIVLNKRQLAGGFAPSPPKGRQVPTKQQRRRMWPLRCARRKGGSPAFRQSSMCHRQLIGEIWTRQQSSSPAHRQSCHEGQKHWQYCCLALKYYLTLCLILHSRVCPTLLARIGQCPREGKWRARPSPVQGGLASPDRSSCPLLWAQAPHNSRSQHPQSACPRLLGWAALLQSSRFCSSSSRLPGRETLQPWVSGALRSAAPPWTSLTDLAATIAAQSTSKSSQGWQAAAVGAGNHDSSPLAPRPFLAGVGVAARSSKVRKQQQAAAAPAGGVGAGLSRRIPRGTPLTAGRRRPACLPACTSPWLTPVKPRMLLQSNPRRARCARCRAVTARCISFGTITRSGAQRPRLACPGAALQALPLALSPRLAWRQACVRALLGAGCC